MRQPSGYEQGNKVCLLKKSLYGLKQSPRQWYRRFDEYMLSNGFKRSSYDSCVYYKSYAPGEYIYLLLYVDNMLIASKSKVEIGSTKILLKREFDMKELEEAKKILGIEIIRDRSHKILRVSQSEYVSKILNNFRVDNGKSVQMPLGGHFKLSLKDYPVWDCDIERMSKVSYENAVGSLMYLMVCTRPDIAYAVSIVSRYLVNPGFVDSDYAKDPDKGRSITGYAILVQGCVVSSKATLQYVVALSTRKAEYMALMEADAIHLSRNDVFHERTKHINLRYHFIREVLEAKTVEVLKVGTEHNAADALTNAVPGHKLQHCLEFLSVDDGVGRCGTMTESVVLVELDCLFFKWPKQLNAHHEVVDIEIANIIEHEKTRQQKKVVEEHAAVERLRNGVTRCIGMTESSNGKEAVTWFSIKSWDPLDHASFFEVALKDITSYGKREVDVVGDTWTQRTGRAWFIMRNYNGNGKRNTKECNEHALVFLMLLVLLATARMEEHIKLDRLCEDACSSVDRSDMKYSSYWRAWFIMRNYNGNGKRNTKECNEHALVFLMLLVLLEGCHAVRKAGISALVKCTFAIRQLAYAAVPDSLDEYLQISEKTSRDCLMHFYNGVIELYGEEYLRRPMQTDVEKVYAFHEKKHGFPGMIGSIDCTKWPLAQCPQAYHAQFSRGDSGSEPFILLEAVASQDLWIWHAFFGVARTNNDVNVLCQSPVLNDLKVGKAPEVPFVANDPGSNDVKRIRYKKAHEAARKRCGTSVWCAKEQIGYQRLNTTARNPVKEILLKLNLPDHRSILTDSKGNPQQDLEDKGVIESGCSRHITGNMSYLTDFEEIDGDMLPLEETPNEGKSQAKLTDESHVLLKVPRKDNMYSVDLKNIVPKGGLTCLFEKATSDESKLWHRRLGHINLVRGLPSKILENN
ncbi:retrovirus-related pol polyprotein from transposon TNT 1-94 [Tanacetum coccineum]|uniref:Retrovirus-related pol polyprotein from transposon TNT 1-94 n=1 Tax=Tanacetum coccineum TaxID=301880 RepID=A0ABQ4WAM7_9ASTR